MASSPRVVHLGSVIFLESASHESGPNRGARSSMTRRIAPGILGLLLGVFLTGCEPAQEEPSAPSPTPPNAEDARSDQWNEMSRVEQLIQELDQSLGELAYSVRNLELPDRRSRALFMPASVVVEDLTTTPAAPTREIVSISTRITEIGAGPEIRDLTLPQLRLWRPLFDEVRYFPYTKFQVRQGHFEADGKEFVGDVVFKAHAALRSGEVAKFSASPAVRWRLLSGADPAKRESWRIVEWRSGSMTRIDAPRDLFREVLTEALPREAQLTRARASVHERLVSQDVLARRSSQKFEAPYEMFAHTAVSQHPAVAVVDVDRDGFDDVYVTVRWGRNQFLHNRGDGTFEERAADLGLDVDSFSNAALFADFDNDGDADLFVGRSLAPSLYLVNEDGRFVDRSATLIEGRIPEMVSSLSAVDYDRDGLLDLYASTYAVQLPLEWIRKHLDPVDFERFVDRVRNQDENPFLDVSGPPNVLLRNAGGGRFEVVRDTGDLAVMRNTYQATWSDYDGDGDADVYIANDFAPDNMIRNDGEGRFVDVSRETGILEAGFGMGAAWGDYDRDGRQDLYVTNMYSKAGSRITGRLDYLDTGFGQAARGNYLYRNQPDGFQRVSGSSGDDLRVERAGWAWGTQFFDADNDGFLDLFALAGFHTAPKEVEHIGDT